MKNLLLISSLNLPWHHSRVIPLSPVTDHLREEISVCSICQLPVNWDLSRFPRQLKSLSRGSQNDIRQLLEYPGMNPIRHHKLEGIQLKKRVPHRFRLVGSLSFWQSWSFSSGLWRFSFKYLGSFLCILVFVWYLCVFYLYLYLPVDKKDSTCNQFVFHVYLPSGEGKLSGRQTKRVGCCW